MAQFNSWEDDPAAQNEGDDSRLHQNVQGLNLNDSRNQQQPGGFRPTASTFTPTASSFTPNAAYAQYYQTGGPQNNMGYNAQSYQSSYPVDQNYGQYQGGYQNHNVHGYPQYGQYGQNPGMMANQHQGGYSAPSWQSSAAPAQQAQQARQQPPQPQQSQQSQPPSTSKPSADSGSAPKAKVLSITATAPPKASASSEAKSKAAAETKKDTAEAKKDAPEAKKDAAPAKATKQSNDKDGKEETASKPTPKASTSNKNQPAEKRDVDAVQKEQSADVDTEILSEMYGKERVNVIFLGHVDAGKSTLGGAILYATGMVDQRTLEKNREEAKKMGRETWYLSWALDLTNEERTKGKTVEVGRSHFETEKRSYAILDAPGHKNYVPSMIGGASQADIGVLVISARKGEFEAGFERSGQTREHAMLAKTQGVNKLVVVINKMDDVTVEWAQERYKECTSKIEAYVTKNIGYRKADLYFMPVAAQTGDGIKERVPKSTCPWWGGPSLLEYLDSMPKLERNVNAPFMMPIAGKYRDLGTMVEGKIEAGVIKKSMSLVMMPDKQSVDVSTLYAETEEEIELAQCGSQVRLRLRGIEEEDVMPGFVLCSPKRLVHRVSTFEAHVHILDIPSLLTAGFSCILHVHAAIEEVRFVDLLHKLEKKTNRRSKKKPAFAKKGDAIIAKLSVVSDAGSVCVERFEDYPQMGRFTLRDKGQTIAIGKITKLDTDES